MGIDFKIKTILENKSISQTKFAKKVGIPRSSMNAYLNDTTDIPYTVLSKMVYELQLDFNSLTETGFYLEPYEKAIIKTLRELPSEDRDDTSEFVCDIINFTNRKRTPRK